MPLARFICRRLYLILLILLATGGWPAQKQARASSHPIADAAHRSCLALIVQDWQWHDGGRLRFGGQGAVLLSRPTDGTMTGTWSCLSGDGAGQARAVITWHGLFTRRDLHVILFDESSFLYEAEVGRDQARNRVPLAKPAR